MTRPPLEEVERVDVAEADGDEWVEVFMKVNQNGDMCEPFMVEWFPHGDKKAGYMNTRVINPDVFEENKQKEYQLFAAVVGSLVLKNE